MNNKCPGCGKKHNLVPKGGVLNPHTKCDYKRRISVRDAHEKVCIQLNQKILELKQRIEYMEVCVKNGGHELYANNTKIFCRQCGYIVNE